MTFFLTSKDSKRRQAEAEKARRNRWEIVKALSHGQVSRRELVRWGLFSGFGLLSFKHGLSPFVRSAHAAVPTGLPSSPLFGVQDFSTAMPRFDVIQNQPGISALTDINGNPLAPTNEANLTRQTLDPALPGVRPGDTGPIEGRPGGALWAHQGWNEFPVAVSVQMTQQGNKGPNTRYNPQVSSQMNSGIDPNVAIPLRFHPGLPIQAENSVWTFNGTVPPKLVLGRYGQPILFRHFNGLPANRTLNNGFGVHTISTHEHNGHHGAENDGFTGAFFYPKQFYDYYWPITLAGFRTINPGATDPKAATPNDNDAGKTNIPGDWRETMSTHWFHDHMFSFTSQNVYKGNAAMFNIYSALDRGNEAINDGVNLRLPSGSAKSWGNLDYDVNLMVADKAWDADGQLAMDIFDFDGFIGDRMTVNLTYKPYFEVERRKYRFRILNASVSRFFKIALVNASGQAQPMTQIANDGNLFPNPVLLTALDEQGIAERYDVVIDFSRFPLNSKAYLVNLAEHVTGLRIAKDLTVADALAGTSADPCVGKFLEFRIVRNPARPDTSQVPNVMIPNPDLSLVPISRTRVFEFGASASQNNADPVSSAVGKWGIATDGGPQRSADFGRVSAAPVVNTREVWVLRNLGGGWDHPIHIHFEEGQVLSRNGSLANVPATERGRKDVYRLRPGGEIQITMQFRDWGGTFMQHCHNTVHEDNAMLLRWQVRPNGGADLTAIPTPIPTPQGVLFRNPTEILPTA